MLTRSNSVPYAGLPARVLGRSRHILPWPPATTGSTREIDTRVTDVQFQAQIVKHYRQLAGGSI
eukprot:6909766-Ditylum_brightwellii.AAC.1